MLEMTWPGREAFRAAPRTTLRLHQTSHVTSSTVGTYQDTNVGGEGLGAPYGWVQRTAGLTWVVLAHASHMAPVEAPEAAHDMLTRWIEGQFG